MKGKKPFWLVRGKILGTNIQINEFVRETNENRAKKEIYKRIRLKYSHLNIDFKDLKNCEVSKIKEGGSG